MIAVPAYMDRFEAAGRGAYMGGGGGLNLGPPGKAVARLNI